MSVSMMGASDVRSAQLDGVVVRCGCSEAQKARGDWHGNFGIECPNPVCVENLGTIASWHRNPIIRWWRNARIALRRR